MKFKTLSRFLAAAFAVGCVFGLTACNNNNPPEDADFYFAENGSGFEVTGLKDSALTEIVIPSSFNGKPVTGIAENAFKDLNGITSVTIPATIETVGKNAFARCEGLEKVNVSDMGAWCEVSFATPASNPLYFAQNLYLDNALVTELKVPDAATKIGDFAFYGYENLVSVDTGNGVKAIGERAFFGCPALESVTVGGGVESIGEQAFSTCEKLQKLSFGENLKEVGGYAFSECVSLNEVSLPSGMEAIGESAFLGCLQLAKFTVNDGLKTIGDAAFAGCTALENFIMPDSVTSIGMGILMNNKSAGFEQGEDSLNNISEIRISNSLTEIPDFAFSNCKIESVTIGNKVTRINYSAFYGCGSLKSVVIPQTVKRISSYAFYKCNALEAVYYIGGAADWQKVVIGNNGNPIKTAPVYYYSFSKPSASGNYWHYVGGVPVVWE